MGAKSLILSLIFSVLSWSAMAYDRLVVYGDSLSSINTCRETNGKIWHEYLLPRLGLAPASLTVPATCGAMSVHLSDQLLTYPGQQAADPNALYVIWIGGNDYLGGLVSNLSRINPLVAMVEGRVEDTIRALHAKGARHFLIPLLPDLGRVPAGARSPAAGLASAIAAAHDRLLIARLPQLAKELTVDITIVDTWTVFDAVLADPKAYGFTEARKSCQEQRGCDINRTVFKDVMHPTTAMHRIIARTFGDALNLPKENQ